MVYGSKYLKHCLQPTQSDSDVWLEDKQHIQFMKPVMEVHLIAIVNMTENFGLHVNIAPFSKAKLKR